MGRKRLTDEERKQGIKESQRKYRKEHRKQLTEYNKKYREKHKERLNAKQRERYKNDKNFRQRQLIANRKYQQNNREKVNKANKIYRINSNYSEYIKLYMQKYRQENRNNIREKEAEYKRRVLLIRRIKKSDIQMNKLVNQLLKDMRKESKENKESINMCEYDYDTREKMFLNIVDNMLTIYKNKNRDYGGSVTQTYNKFGLTSFLVRLSDKLDRLISLNDKKEILVKDEKIEDTLIDLANYAILALIELKLDKGDNK